MSRAEATEELFQETYGTLRLLAQGALRRERSGHTLQPTALVHEAYLRLSNRGRPWCDRSHFLALAARAMRQVLVDWARSRARLKRGGPSAVRITLDENVGPDVGQSSVVDVLHFDEALSRLGRYDERKARLLELRVFAGLSVAEAATELGVSEATVGREWRATRAWMAWYLTDGPETTEPVGPTLSETSEG